MLVVTRRLDERLAIADNIEVAVLEISKDRVKLGISAPKDVKIIRSELIEAQNANRESALVPSKKVIDAMLSSVPTLKK